MTDTAERFLTTIMFEDGYVKDGVPFKTHVKVTVRHVPSRKAVMLMSDGVRSLEEIWDIREKALYSVRKALGQLPPDFEDVEYEAELDVVPGI